MPVTDNRFAVHYCSKAAHDHDIVTLIFVICRILSRAYQLTVIHELNGMVYMYAGAHEPSAAHALLMYAIAKFGYVDKDCHCETYILSFVACDSIIRLS